MKFNILRSIFFEAVKVVQNITGEKTNVPILENMMLELSDKELVLTTSDIDLSIRSSVECDAIVKGATTLPAKYMFNFLATAPEGVISVDVSPDDVAVVNAGSARMKLIGKSALEYPKMNADEILVSYEIDRKKLYDMLRRTYFSASQDDTRRALKGVLVRFKDGKITMVATDGRRMSLVEEELEFNQSDSRDIVLPIKTVTELLRNLNGDGKIKISLLEKKVLFEYEKYKLYSKLIEDKYPDYLQVIPLNNNIEIKVDRLLLMSALDRVNVISSKQVLSAKLIFEDNKLVVKSSANAVGEAKDVIYIKYIGEKIESNFNPNYINDALKVIDDDEVEFCIENEHKRVIIRSQESFIYVMMPLKIS